MTCLSTCRVPVHHFNCPDNPYGPGQCICCGVRKDDPYRKHLSGCDYTHQEWFWGWQANGLPQRGLAGCGHNNGAHGMAWVQGAAQSAPTQATQAGALPPIVLEEQDHSYLAHNPWRDVALACKAKHIRLWPDYD